MLIQAVDRAQTSQAETANPSSELSKGQVGGGTRGARSRMARFGGYPEDPSAAGLHGTKNYGPSLLHLAQILWAPP